MVSNQPEIKLIFRRIFRYWYLYLIGLPLCAGLGVYYLASTPEIYEASALILIKDQEESGEVSEEYILDEFGVRSRFRNLENEILVLTSYPLIEMVVEKLELEYHYFSSGRFMMKDLYKKSPVQIVEWKVNENCRGTSADCHPLITITSNDGTGYTLATEDSTYNGIWGSELVITEGNLTLTKSSSIKQGEQVVIDISTIKGRVVSIKNKLEVEAVGKNSSTLKLSFRDRSSRRANDILQEIIFFYNDLAIKEKSEVYKNTIDLINDRINLVIEELSSAETGLESYKQRFNLVEVGSEATLILNDLSSYNKEITDQDVQLEILSSIEEFLINEKDSFTFVPTNLNLTNLTLSKQLESFNRLLSERDRLSTDLGVSHPDLKLIERQIQNLRETIIFNIQSIKTDLRLSQEATKEYKQSLEDRLQSLPSRERALIEMERQKTVKENLYLYLLQKREEAAVSLVVVDSPGKVIQPPVVRGPVSPMKTQILFISIFFGFAIPSLAIFLLETFNDQVRSEDELKNLTSAPIIGSIAQARKKKYLLVQEHGTTVVDEMFRSLRSNLSYVSPGHSIQVLLTTSSMPGEGKSFTALNLGMTQALADKKVLIIDLDLRQSNSIFKKEKSMEIKGVVNYLIDNSIALDSIIENSGHHPNLDVISTGPKPPDPGEIILSQALKKLLKLLKQQYDFIILDSPPISLVSDAFQIGGLADATMFIVRSGVTRRSQLFHINESLEYDKLPNIFIVFNGVRLGKLYNYGTRYQYQNKEYYGHKDESVLRTVFSLVRIKKIFKGFRRLIRKK